jgi:predicted nucleic acid-binding protein
MIRPVIYVTDASVAAPLYLVEQLSPQSVLLFDLLANDPSTVFHVPDLFYAECANIFWKQCQRGIISPTKAQTDIVSLLTLSFKVTPTFDLVDAAISLSLAHVISAYDACYVALAQREAVPLITADQKLAQKLANLSPPVIWLGHWTPPAQKAPIASPPP